MGTFGDIWGKGQETMEMLQIPWPNISGGSGRHQKKDSQTLTKKNHETRKNAHVNVSRLSDSFSNRLTTVRSAKVEWTDLAFVKPFQEIHLDHFQTIPKDFAWPWANPTTGATRRKNSDSGMAIWWVFDPFWNHKEGPLKNKQSRASWHQQIARRGSGERACPREQCSYWCCTIEEEKKTKTAHS